MNDYYNVAEVETACVNLAANYPGLASLIVLPHITAEGRTSRALHISDGRAGKPVFMVIGAQHGGEWGSCEIALNLAADLLGAMAGPLPLHYGPVTFQAGAIQALLDRFDIVIFPLVNPDGRFFSQQTRTDWRKNRNLAYATPGKPQTIGVDLNRNHDFAFQRTKYFDPGAVISTSTQSFDDTFQGPAPSSEAETQNLRWLVDQYPQLRCFVDLHSGDQGVIYPWGDDELQHTDASMAFHNPVWDHRRGLAGAGNYREYMLASDLAMHQALAAAFIATATQVNGRPFGHLPGFNFRASSGTSHDWMFSRHVGAGGGAMPTRAVAVEWCSSTQRPDFPEMEHIVTDVSAGLIAMAMTAAGLPV